MAWHGKIEIDAEVEVLRSLNDELPLSRPEDKRLVLLLFTWTGGRWMRAAEVWVRAGLKPCSTMSFLALLRCLGCPTDFQRLRKSVALEVK